MRIILHIDMDAFFASIEERENPALRGKPIVIGADPAPVRINGRGGAGPKGEPIYHATGRGVVSTASYAARKYGIHSAMPISRAWQLCPAPVCVYLPVDMKLYGIVSERIMKLVREVVQDVPMEQVSVDEAYVEIKNEECSIKNCIEEAREMAIKVKKEIKKRERLSCSVGIGPNKLIAKIASDVNKPDGLTVVCENEVQAFLDPMHIRKIPGIGPKSEKILNRIGVTTVGELRNIPQAALVDEFGSWGEEMYEKAHGQDSSPVVQEYEAKSLGHEITFDHDTKNQALLTKTLMELCDEVIGEVMKEHSLFKTVTIRVRFENFETHTSAHTVKNAVDDVGLLKKTALQLLFPYFKGKRCIRLLGVRVSHLQAR